MEIIKKEIYKEYYVVFDTGTELDLYNGPDLETAKKVMNNYAEDLVRDDYARIVKANEDRIVMELIYEPVDIYEREKFEIYLYKVEVKLIK